MQLIGAAWRGEIGLGQAFWMIAVPIYLLSCVPAFLMPESFFMAFPLLSLLLICVLKISLATFAVVCVWRAASGHEIDDSSAWPSLARIGMILYAIVMIAPSLAFLFIATMQYVKDPNFLQKAMVAEPSPSPHP